MLLHTWSKTSAGPKFNLTEWWKIGEGGRLSEPFDVGEELVAGLLSALEMVRSLFYIQTLYSTRATEGSWSGASFKDDQQVQRSVAEA